MTSSEGQALLRVGFTFDLVAPEGAVEQRLVLRSVLDTRMSPLSVDFLDAKLRYRLSHDLGKNQILARALGLKKRQSGIAPLVFDATAGMGVDAFLMAAYGYRVRSVERVTAVAWLLRDGYQRLREQAMALAGELPQLPRSKQSQQLQEIAERLSFEAGDATVILSSMDEDDRPDIVYLDPMYPDEGRSASALPKKAMQIFRQLIGGDHDADLLLDAALKAARNRVVVKRPVRAAPLLRPPNHSFAGKIARYDMYLCGH